MNNTLLASAARDATATTEDVVTPANVRGTILIFDLTAAPEETEDTLAVSIEARDPATGKYVTVTAFTAVSEVGTFAFTLYPGAVETTTVANHEVMGLPLPSRWRAKVTHPTPEEEAEAGEWTYSLGCLALR